MTRSSGSGFSTANTIGTNTQREHEFFLTLSGHLVIDTEGGESVDFWPQQGYVVPRGVIHKTRAAEKTVVLMIETYGIVPTGDE